MLVQAILVGLVGAFGCLDYQLGTLYAFRPIVLCPLVGLVLGDLQTGIAVGASLELLFMGSISIGAYVPPNETVGGVLACAFAIQLGQGTETAIALAIALELPLDEMKDMLMKAGFALSHSNKFDIIVEYFVERGNYNVFEINEALFAFDQSLIGA